MDKGVFVSRAEAESTTLKELLERYLDEDTPLKKGAASETNRLTPGTIGIKSRHHDINERNNLSAHAARVRQGHETHDVDLP